MSTLEKLSKVAELSAFKDGLLFLSKTYGLAPPKPPPARFPFSPPSFDSKDVENRAVDRVHNLYSSVSSVLLSPQPDVPKDVPILPFPTFVFEAGFSISGLPDRLLLKDFVSLPFEDPDEPRYAAALVEAELTVLNTDELAKNFFGEREDRRWKWTDPEEKSPHHPYKKIELKMREFVVKALWTEVMESVVMGKVDTSAEVSREIGVSGGDVPKIKYLSKDGEEQVKTSLNIPRRIKNVWVRIVVPIWHLAEFVQERSPVTAHYDLFGPKEELTKLPPTPEVLRTFAAFSRRNPLRPLDFVVKDLPRGPATERLSQKNEELFAEILRDEPWKYVALRGASNLPDTDVLLSHLDPGGSQKILFQKKYEEGIPIPAGPEWMVTKESERKRLVGAWNNLSKEEKTINLAKSKKRAERTGEIPTLDWLFGPSLTVLRERDEKKRETIGSGEIWDFDPKTPKTEWLRKDLVSLDRFAIFIEANRSAHVARLEEKRGGPFSGSPKVKEVRVEREIWEEIFGSEWKKKFKKFSRALGGETDPENPLWPRERMEVFRTGDRPRNVPEDPELRKVVLEALKDNANTKLASESIGFLPYFVEVVPPEKNSLLRLENSAEARPPASVRKKLSTAFEELYLGAWWNPAAKTRGGILSPSAAKEVEHLVALGLVPKKKISLEIWAETKLQAAVEAKRPGEIVRILKEYIETMDAAFGDRKGAIQSATNVILGDEPKRKGLRFVSKKDKTSLSHTEASAATLFLLSMRPKGFTKRVNSLLVPVDPGVDFFLRIRMADTVSEFFGERFYLRTKEIDPSESLTLFDLWNFARETDWPPFAKIKVSPTPFVDATPLPEGVLDGMWIGYFVRNRNGKHKAHIVVGSSAKWNRESLSKMRRLPFARNKVVELLKDQKREMFEYYTLLRIDFELDKVREKGIVKAEITLAIPHLDFPVDSGDPTTLAAAAMQDFVKTGMVKAVHKISCFDDFLCK